VLSIGLAVLALGLSLAALSPSWPLFAASICIGGMGFGAIDFTAVSLVSRTASPERASRLTVSAAGWGFGAIAGPLLVVIIRPTRFELFLWIAAVIALGLIALVRGVDAPRVGLVSEVPLTVVHRRHDRHKILVTFLAAFGTYVALETAIAGWIATQLHGSGFVAATGSLVTAGFWAGLAVGRLGAAPVARRWTSSGLVVGGLSVTVALLLAASSRAIAPVAYPLVGFTVAAVFPLGIDWFTQLSPGDDNGVAWLLLIGTVGGILGSGAQSVAVAEFGLSAIPFVAAGLAVLCLAMFASARRFDVAPIAAAKTPG
jgi:fucose permease